MFLNMDKNFLKLIIPLVIPIAIQNLINVGVTTADIVMLGKFNENSLAAASLASQISFVVTLIMFGMSSGANVLAAQYWGKKDINTIEKIMAIGIKNSLFVSFVFFFFSLFFPRLLMRIFTDNEVIIAEGIKYLRIVSFTYITSSISIVYLSILRSVERVKISTFVYATSFVANVIINYILIFGKFGFPRLGIIGAAIATLIARIIEIIIVFIYNEKNKKFLHVKVKYLFKNNKILSHDFYKYSIPVVLNEMLWSLGTAGISVIVGRINSSFIAANAINSTIRQCVMPVTFGLAAAASIILGKTIGEKKYEKTVEYAHKFLKFTFFSTLLGGLLIFLSTPLIVKFFALNDSVVNYLSFMLKINVIYSVIQGITVCLIVGIFRAGGDTKFALIVDVGPAWCGSLILGSLAAFYFKFPPKIIFLFLMTDELIKLPFAVWRYRSRKWLNNVTREIH